MNRRRTRKSPKSLSSSQVVMRVFIAGVALFLLVFAAILVNHWYLYTQSKGPAQNISAENSKTQQQPENELPPALPPPSASTDEANPDTSLTFYDNLVGKGTPDSLGSPSSADTKAASPAEKTSAGAGGNRCYTVQVGSFQSLESAEGIIESLKKKGYSPSLATVSLPNGKTWHRVRIGNCSSREEAEILAQKIKEGGNFEPMIISPEKNAAAPNNTPGLSATQSPASVPQGSPADAAPKP